MNYRPIAAIILMLLASLAGCLDGGDTSVEEEADELKANIVTSTDDENSSFSAEAMVTGGESPYTYKWRLDGAEMLVMGDTLSMSGLTTGQHSITLSVGSKDGQSIDLNGVFTIAEPIPEPVNTPPTCSMTATAQVYEGEEADWNLEMQDADGDT
ncbi:MAG: PKD domain-containing protein, partial [Candidatus Poseidoniia archaeon]